VGLSVSNHKDWAWYAEICYRMTNLIRKSHVALALLVTGCGARQPSSKGAVELALSSTAQEKGDYRTALKHAQKAVELSPGGANAHFAVAGIADDMCFPSANPGPDMRLCNLAIDEYKRTLQLDSTHREALKDLAYLLWQFGRGEESQGYYRKALALEPNDSEALAAIAVNRYMRSYRDIAPRNGKAGIDLERPNEMPWCSEARNANLARLNEVLSYLTKAQQINGDKSDFAVWLGLTYRLRAAIQCGNSRAFAADIGASEKWEKLSAKTRKFSDNSPHRYPPPPPPPPG
jgi:tetratricopeptide (TPR) repeat protein